MTQLSIPSTAPLAVPVHREADLSACGRYRWTLSRWWESPASKLSWVCWIMLNPSTADASVDDPTIRRCIHFSRSWGYPGLVVVNLYPFRSADPRECRKWVDWSASRSILAQNRLVVIDAALTSSLVVAAWGAAPGVRDWAQAVCRSIYAAHVGDEAFSTIHCLGTTAGGDPKHPLARGLHRVPDDQQPVVWRAP